MGSLISKTTRLRDSRWVFPIKEAVRQVVPPEYVERGALEDYVDEEEAATARAIEIGNALKATTDEPSTSKNNMEPSLPHPDQPSKTTLKYYRLFSDWLPRLGIGSAVCMLILNIFMPGIGTMAFSFKWFSPEDFIIPTTMKQRSSIVLTCMLYGLIQLLLAPFLFGWFWAIATGVLAIQQAKWVAIAEQYSHVIEQKLKDMLQERMARARQLNNGEPVVDLTAAWSSSPAIHNSAGGGGGGGNQGRGAAGGAPAAGASTTSAANSQAQQQARTTTTAGSSSRTTPKINRRRSNDIQPAAAANVDNDLDVPVFNSRDPSFVADSNSRLSSQGGQADNESRSSRVSSRKSSRKSALSLSLNRISPAPTPAAKLSVSSSSRNVLSSSSSAAEAAVADTQQQPPPPPTQSHQSTPVRQIRSRVSFNDEPDRSVISTAHDVDSKAWDDQPTSMYGGGEDNNDETDLTGTTIVSARVHPPPPSPTPQKHKSNNNDTTRPSEDFSIEDI